MTVGPADWINTPWEDRRRKAKPAPAPKPKPKLKATVESVCEEFGVQRAQNARIYRGEIDGRPLEFSDMDLRSSGHAHGSYFLAIGLEVPFEPVELAELAAG